MKSDLASGGKARGRWAFVYLGLLLLGASLYAADPAPANELGLTPAEQTWLTAHPEIRIGVSDHWPPLNFIDAHGAHQGVGAGYLEALNQRLGGVLKAVPQPFADSIAAVKEKRLDALMDVTPKPERETFLNFTAPYLRIPHAIIGRRGEPYFAGEDDLAGKTVAIEKGYYTVKRLATERPEIKVRQYENTELCLDAVSRGEVDAYIGNRAVAMYLIGQELLGNLQVMGRASTPSVILAIGCRKDWPELSSILDKALASLSPADVRAIHLNWLGDDSSTPHPVILDQAERAWLDKHGSLTVGCAQDAAPYAFKDLDGTGKGIAVDVLRLAAKRIDLPITIVTDTSENLLRRAEKGEVQVLASCTGPEAAWRDVLAPLPPYLKIENVAVVARDGLDVRSSRDLAGLRLVVEQGAPTQAYFAEHHPEQLTVAKSSIAALIAVSSGEADAYVGDYAVASFYRKRQLLTNLRMGRFDELDPIDIRMGVAIGQDVLTGLLAKLLDTVTEEEKSSIVERYCGLLAGALTRVRLTPEERAWFARNPVVRVGAISDYAPYEFVDSEGNYKGIAVDQLRLVAQRVGFKIEPVIATWNVTLENAKQGKVSLLPELKETESRREFLDFTTPNIVVDHVFVTRQDAPPVTSMNDLKGKTIAVGKGYYIHEYLVKEHPDYRLHLVDNPQQALVAVSTSQADVYIGAYAVVAYITRQHMITGLKTFPCNELGTYEFSMGVRKDLPELHSAVQKGLDSITGEEKREIIERYYALDQKSASLSSLTNEERRWLNSHPVIRVHNEQDWPPYNYFEHGQPQGFSVDYMNLIASKVGLEVNYVSGPSWDEFMQMIKAKQLDVMLNIVETPERDSFLLFTEPYIRTPNVIVSRRSDPLTSIEELKGKVVAYPAGFFQEEILKRSYPGVKRMPVADALASLKAVALGQADACLSGDATARYLIGRDMLTSLTVSGEVLLGDPELTNMRLAIRNDWPQLRSILGKAMAAVTPKEMAVVREKWLTTTVAQDSLTASSSRVSLWRSVGMPVGVVVLLVFGVWIVLRLFGDRLPMGLQAPGVRLVFIVAIAAFLTAVIGGSIVGLRIIENRTRARTGAILRSELEATQDRLRSWARTETERLDALARDPVLLPAIKRLLEVPHERDSLLSSPALEEVRAYFRVHGALSEDEGFFVIAPDYTNMGSRRDTNVGWRNLIAEQRPEALEHAFSGKSVIVLPIRSDVRLTPADKPVSTAPPATMFVAAPVRDETGKVIAVITLRKDPAAGFSELCRSARLGNTGETYAFDSAARFLSTSHFSQELIRTGLLQPGQQHILNLEIRDPGGDLLEGYHTTTPRLEQPLTHMAAEAIAGRPGMDLAGYRDYRGVRVLGVWLWDRDLGLGLASEIDEREALADYRVNRTIVGGVLGVVMLLAFVLTAVIVWSGERAKRELRQARDEWEQVASERTVELREREQRFRAIFGQTVQLMAVLDTDGTLEEANHTAVAMAGVEERELQGRPFWQCPGWGNSPENRQSVQDAIARARDGEIVRLEIVFPVPDGSQRVIDSTFASVTDPDGKVAFLLAMGHDITERKRMEEALSRRAEWAAGLQRAGQELSHCTTVKEVAEVACRTTVDNLHLHSVWVGVPTESGHMQLLASAGQLPAGTCQSDRTCQHEVIETGSVVINADTVASPPAAICPDHAEHCAAGSCASFPIRVGDQCVGAFSMRSPGRGEDSIVVQLAPLIETLVRHVGHVWQRCLLDAERRQALALVESQKEFLETTLNSLAHPFYVINVSDYSIALMNNAARESGKKGAATCHALTHNCQTPCSGDRDPCPMEVVKRTRQAVVVEHVHQGHDGNTRTLEVHGYPILDDDGNVVQMIEYSVDITERKLAEEELHRNLSELERFNRLAVDRELRMIEIKEEINGLLSQSGREPKYRIVTDEQPPPGSPAGVAGKEDSDV